MAVSTPQDLKKDEIPSRKRFLHKQIKYGKFICGVVFLGLTLSHIAYTPDDTFIYLQYAKNIALGNGFSFNPGEPSNGITGPLWVLLLATGNLLGADALFVAKALDVIFACLALIILYSLALAIIPDEIYALLALIIFSFDAWFLRWTGSGMETSLSVCLALICVWSAYLEKHSLTGFFSGALTMVRPEGGLLFLIIVGTVLLGSDNKKRGLRSSLVLLGMFCVLALPWMAFSYLSFGSLIPNTFAAKTSDTISIFEAFYAALSQAKIIGATQIFSLLAFISGLVITLRREGITALRQDRVTIAWIFALPLAYALLGSQVVSRYLLLITPFIVIYGIWGIKKMETLLLWPRTRSFQLVAIVTLLSIGLNQFVYQVQVLPHTQKFTEGMEECLRPISIWLREKTPETAVVLTPDVGLLGYVSERRMFDTAGLVSPEVKRAFKGLNYEDGMIQGRYLSVVNPDYILDRSHTPERLASSALVPLQTCEFPSLGITKDLPYHYTLYRVVK